MTQMSENEKNYLEHEKNYLEIEQDLRRRYRKNLWCRFTKAIREYELVQEGELHCSLYFRRQRIQC